MFPPLPQRHLVANIWPASTRPSDVYVVSDKRRRQATERRQWVWSAPLATEVPSSWPAPAVPPAAAHEPAARPAPRAGSGTNRPATLADVDVAPNDNAVPSDGAALALNDFGQALNRVADELARQGAELRRILDAVPALSGACRRRRSRLGGTCHGPRGATCDS
jgi:hypothetical protein